MTDRAHHLVLLRLNRSWTSFFFTIIISPTLTKLLYCTNKYKQALLKNIVQTDAEASQNNLPLFMVARTCPGHLISPAGSHHLFSSTLPECWWQIVSAFIQVEQEEKQPTAQSGRPFNVNKERERRECVHVCVWGGSLVTMVTAPMGVTWCLCVILPL